MADQNDPDYAEYQQYLEYLKHVQAPKSQAVLSVGSEDSAKPTPVLSKEQVPAMEKAIPQGIGMTLPYIGGALGSAVGPEGTGLGAAVGNIAAATLGAGVGSEAKNLVTNDPAPVGEAVKNVAKDAFTKGTLPELGSQVISGLASFLGKGADRAQQIGMGMKKYSPGVGTTAIESGVRGTRAGMQSKMADALSTQGEALDNMVSGLKGSVDSGEVANRVADYGDKYVSPGGYSTDAGFDRAGDAFNRASDINARGEISPVDARSIAQTAEKAEGYSPMGTPKQNYQAKLAQQEAQGYRDALRQLGDQQGVPVREQMTKLHQLLKGSKALNTPESINWNSPITGLTKAALKETVASGPVMTYGAAAANGASNAMSSPVVQQSPRLLQFLQMLNQGKGNGQTNR